MASARNGRIERQSYSREAFNFFKENRYGIERVFTHRTVWSEEGRDIAYFWGKIFRFLYLGNFVLPSSVVLNKEALLEVGMFNESYRVAEETEFFLRFSRKFPMGFVDHPLLVYSLPSEDNLSGKSNLAKLIRGGLRAQTEILESVLKDEDGDAQWFRKGIAKTHARLAYYHLTEYENRAARRCAIDGMRACRSHPRVYLLLLATLLPRPILKALASMKGRALKRRPSIAFHSEGNA